MSSFALQESMHMSSVLGIMHAELSMTVLHVARALDAHKVLV